jgi:hypothetical protein
MSTSLKGLSNASQSVHNVILVDETTNVKQFLLLVCLPGTLSQAHFKVCMLWLPQDEAIVCLVTLD